MLFLGSWLSSRIQSLMSVHWQKSVRSELGQVGKPADLIYKLRTHPAYIAIHNVIRTHLAPAVFAVLFVYGGLALTSHVLFNVQDDAGLVCRETGTRLGLGRREGVTIDFRPSELCQSTGVVLEEHGRYRVTFGPTASFRDADIDGSKGFYSFDPPSLAQKLLMVMAVPLRRELIRPWFRIVARIGGKGGEESFLDPDPKDGSIEEVVTATRDGELFLFVNDAVIGIPGLYDFFYGDNSGSTKVKIERLS